ncbi:Rpn family recombination-promoting nuclease/putative transposase [Arachidicoccus terrestris]|uniref:Rpn family recombination-promoting nuclease/putative transposase n=1 Tax=Arachidicoccus terrestris TaxID=2875539 RepID=UPI001CC7A761|nr:Rpn family recombination-promoting nuclease/putative transposase [Arachidicoccus terrestris]UAY56113.1 Rpn family recombination-promoting nuclease/putative transposase [Arachidicoccus terrestris]
MDNIIVSSIPSASVPYGLVVDRLGRLTNREVRERPLKRDVRPQFRKEDELIQPGQSPSKEQLENLKKDVIFKMLLGDEDYAKQVAIPFIKAFWGHLTEVTDLKLKTTTLTGSTKDSRNVCPDTVWQSQKTGDVFLIEMQRRYQDFYNQRLSLYDGKLRATLAKKSSDWDYNQVSVFVLGMADFDLERPASDSCIYEYVSMNTKNNQDLLTGRDWKMLIDLRKASRVRQAAYSERDKWIYLLNNFHKLKRIPAFLKEGYFDQVIKIAKNLNRTKMEELEDFFWENYQKDLAREAKAEERAIWMNKIKNIIKSFISLHPNYSIQEAAAQLGIEERLVRSVFPAGV